jgi:hypothetical protein
MMKTDVQHNDGNLDGRASFNCIINLFTFGLRFKSCDCIYNDYWRLTWSLISGPVGLVEVRASWPEHPY